MRAFTGLCSLGPVEKICYMYVGHQLYIANYHPGNSITLFDWQVHLMDVLYQMVFLRCFLVFFLKPATNMINAILVWVEKKIHPLHLRFGGGYHGASASQSSHRNSVFTLNLRFSSHPQTVNLLMSSLPRCFPILHAEHLKSSVFQNDWYAFPPP